MSEGHLMPQKLFLAPTQTLGSHWYKQDKHSGSFLKMSGEMKSKRQIVRKKKNVKVKDTSSGKQHINTCDFSALLPKNI